MAQQLNAVGVPAARVRRLGEFLDEAQGMPGTGWQPTVYRQARAQARCAPRAWAFAIASTAHPTARARPRQAGTTRRCSRRSHARCLRHPLRIGGRGAGERLKDAGR